MIDICRRERVDLLLIAGDLFHRQPLLRELKEVDYLFSTLNKTEVVLIAGNHDYLKRDSYYRSFKWSGNVHMILKRQVTEVNLPRISTAVYGSSYDARQIEDRVYEGAAAPGRQTYEILLLHGGDGLHVPFDKHALENLQYDYIALGHIHKPGEVVPGRAVYAGALEPTDKNDMGAHGYIRGEITLRKSAEGPQKECSLEFVPAACREYIHLDVKAEPSMTGYALRDKIKAVIDEHGKQNMYQIHLTGFRDPEARFDLSQMDVYGNLVGITDGTNPAYDFEKLRRQNADNLLGKYIESFRGAEAGSVEYEALCRGVHALIETKKETL